MEGEKQKQKEKERENRNHKDDSFPLIEVTDKDGTYVRSREERISSYDQNFKLPILYFFIFVTLILIFFFIFQIGVFSIFVKLKNTGISMDEAETVNGNKNGNSALQLPYKEFLLPLTDFFLTNLADVFSLERDTDSLIDNDLCGFVRCLLGH